MSALFHRFTALCAIASFWLACGPAQAQLVTAPQSGLQLTRLEVLHNVPNGLSLRQVLSGQAGAFIETTDLQISHPYWYRAMWLRLHLKAAPDHAAASDSAVLFFPKPYLDQLRLFTPGKTVDEPWAMQQSGDFVPPAAWPVRSLHPKFLLPSAQRVAASQGQSMVLYVQMEHLAPVVLGLNLTDSTSSFDEDALSLLIYGVGLGAILIAALFTVSLAWTYRDAIYVWYSLYACAAMLACASHSGIAHHVLWPVEGAWPGTASFFFLTLSFVGLMQFSRCVNLAHRSAQGMRWLVHILSAACLVACACYVLFDAAWQWMYYALHLLFILTSGVTLGCMMYGWRSNSHLARAWLIAFIPLGITVSVALLEGVGIVASTYWFYNAVILAVCLEVLILGMALQWFASERHGEKERQRALASTDPLTGFASANSFRQHLHNFWESSQDSAPDSAVVYVALRNNERDAKRMERLLLRSVRVLRAATRTQDTVARLEDNLLAILMPDVRLGEDLSQRLSRIIALGLMPESDSLQQDVLRFRIAYTTRMHYGRRVNQLHVDLLALLDQPSGWNSRPIRVLDLKKNARSRPREAIDSSDLEDLWDKALDQQTPAKH